MKIHLVDKAMVLREREVTGEKNIQAIMDAGIVVLKSGEEKRFFHYVSSSQIGNTPTFYESSLFEIEL